jgi:hypothetical protein
MSSPKLRDLGEVAQLHRRDRYAGPENHSFAVRMTFVGGRVGHELVRNELMATTKLLSEARRPDGQGQAEGPARLARREPLSWQLNSCFTFCYDQMCEKR